MVSDKPSPTPRLAALRYRDFRLVWFGQLVSIIGSQMQQTTIEWHINDLLRSSSYPITIFDRMITLHDEAGEAQTAHV